jgi:hypothetical protein
LSYKWAGSGSIFIVYSISLPFLDSAFIWAVVIVCPFDQSKGKLYWL